LKFREVEKADILSKSNLPPSKTIASAGLKSAFFLQFPDRAIIDQVLCFEAPNLLVVGAQHTNDVANAIDAGIDFFS
jgi:hypothetical protein